MISGLGPTELIVILIIALVIFGPGRLAGIGGALGQAIRDFKRALSGVHDEIKKIDSEVKNEAKEEKGE